MIAKVIVDVPAKETDRPFDYRVPEPLAEWVDVGSRVGVPFGPRVIQGFVVGFADESEVASGRIRDIQSVLDLVPPLTGELVELSRWMSRTYLCKEILALQAMVPSALKAKYERIVGLAEPSAAAEPLQVLNGRETELVRYLEEKGDTPLDELLERFPGCGAAVRSLVRQGVLAEEQKIRDRVGKKRVLTVFPPDDPRTVRDALAQLDGKAKRQADILHYFLDNPAPVALADLTRSLGISPSSVKALHDKGWLRVAETEVDRDPYASRAFGPTKPLALTPEQREVYGRIRASLDARKHEVFLLHGVTGSGKTEVYLQLIEACLAQEREAIVLVPEISLTPQMVERFKGRFGSRVAVLHSRLSQGERYDEWRKIQLGRVTVAIGARSAVFAPFQRLGLLIIDEEHESSYKQEDSPKYHAREVAAERARMHGAAVVLGSATPSLETFHAASEEAGDVRLLTMPSRVEGRPMPGVSIVDMREELKLGNRSMFSRKLHELIRDRADKGEQTILLLNRRGFSTFVMCRSCGYVVTCPHCEISLTYHQHARTLRCHYCGYAEKEAETCPACGSEHIRYFGTGTQRVEAELGKLFPGLRVIRMDADTTSGKGAHEKLLARFRDHQADVLLGTQMVAKGLDFPLVTLVGVISADTVLNLPDFRASERTFQLLTQVAGRAGRDALPGEVVIQTYTPEHYSIQTAGRHDYAAFVERELRLRRQMEYPPYCRMLLITLSHEQLPLLVRTGEAIADALRSRWEEERERSRPGPAGEEPFFEVLGPVASPIPRIKDRYRFQCIVKFRGGVPAADMVRGALRQADDLISRDNVQIGLDVNPHMLM